MQNLLERKLAGVLRATLSADSVYLFNEHFVVKPPGAGRFAWHTDAAHQLEAVLALSASPASHQLAEYASAWIALDDVDASNGQLLLLPRDAPQPPGARPLEPAGAAASVLARVGRGGGARRAAHRARGRRDRLRRDAVARVRAQRVVRRPPRVLRAVLAIADRDAARRAAPPRAARARAEEAAARRRRFSYLTSLTTRTRAHPLMARPPDDVCSAGGTWMKNIQSDGVLGSRPIMDIL